MAGAEQHIQATGEGFTALALLPEGLRHRQVHPALGLDAGAGPGKVAAGFQVGELDEQGAGLVGVTVIAMAEAAEVEQVRLPQQGEYRVLTREGQWAAAMEGQVGANQRCVETRCQPQRRVHIQQREAQGIGGRRQSVEARRVRSSVFSSHEGEELDFGGGGVGFFLRATCGLGIGQRGDQFAEPETRLAALQMRIGQRGQFGVDLVAPGQVAVAGATVGQAHHAAGHAHFADVERRTLAAHAAAHQGHANFRGADHVVLGVFQGRFMG
ncbi:hypothetical protein BHE74_00000580 [Ensete ventricosum]|nr:hypothetical protein BHE74_00000580 [Ensete ventricosum]